MKTLNLFVGLLLALFVIVGCSSDDNTNNDNNLILGVWSESRCKASDFNNQNWYNLTEPITLEFLSNKTFVDRYNGSIDGGGTWSISGKTLKMTYQDEEWGSETIHYEILVLDETTLQVKESFGEEEWEIIEYIKE